MSVKARTIGEVLSHNKKLVKHADKVAWLKERGSNVSMYYFLWVALGGKVKWLLPEGMPPIKEHKGRVGSEPSDINREIKRLYLFLDGTGNNLTQLRREKLFAVMLESVSKEEGEMLVAAKDGTFEKAFRCPKKVVEEAFPGLFDAPFTNYFIQQR